MATDERYDIPNYGTHEPFPDYSTPIRSDWTFRVPREWREHWERMSNPMSPLTESDIDRIADRVVEKINAAKVARKKGKSE
jgi:hypothetical protein